MSGGTGARALAGQDLPHEHRPDHGVDARL